MSDWQDLPLGDVLTLQRGFDLPTRARVPGPFPVVSSSGVTGSHAEYKVEPPGVVIGRYGSLGSVHWITERYWPLNTSLWVKDFRGNDPLYLRYLMETVSVDGSTASAVRAGAARPRAGPARRRTRSGRRGAGRGNGRRDRPSAVLREGLGGPVSLNGEAAPSARS